MNARDFTRRGTAIVRQLGCGIFFFWAAVRPGLSPGDVVVLRNGRAYAGIIERTTSQSVVLFDGNLRRVVAVGDVKQIIRERQDTSWAIVGDMMVQQRDWDAAAAAYRRALEKTRQPDVLLGRLKYMGALRYVLPGSEKANELLQSHHYREAATALFDVVLKAADVAQRHYWTERLAQAYVGLASQRMTSATVEVDPYLVYALAMAPDCGAAHRLLGERLEAAGLRDIARWEFLLALDFDPAEARARARLAAYGETWTYDPNTRDRSGLRDTVEGRPRLAPAGRAPLTTRTLAAAIRPWMEATGLRPGRLLLAAYLGEPTAALAYEGTLPYPGDEKLIPAILAETANTSGTTPYDIAIIKMGMATRIDPRFVRAIAKILSACKPDYVSPDGRRGLIPLRRQQWEMAARALNLNWSFDTESGDPEKNVRLSYGYLQWLRSDCLRPYAGTRLDHLERIYGNLGIGKQAD